MEPPSLTLRILQGPTNLQGETLEFKPGSAIRIGRLVRGNNIPIKDPGISSKHLCILTESGEWVLRDLDSSNGTVLNCSKVPPQTPFPLHDGSTIKIGELTSILVNFINPTRITVPEPDPEAEGLDAPAAKPGRDRRGKGLKGKVVIQSVNVGDESGYVDRTEDKRVTRNSKNNRCVVGVSDSSAGNLGALEEKVEEPKNTRVTRNSKNKRKVIEIADSSVGNSDALEEKEEELKNARATRNSKNKRKVIEIADSSVGNSDALEEKVEEPKNVRATRNSKNKRRLIEIADPSVGNSDALEEKVEEPKNARATRNSKNKRRLIEIADSDASEEKLEEPKDSRVARKRKWVNSQASSLQVGVGNVEEEKKGTWNSDAPEEKVEEPRRTRVTRNSKNPQASSLQPREDNVEEKKTGALNSDAPEEKVEELRIMRVTRCLKNKQSVIGDSPQTSSMQVGVENVEKKKTRGGGRRKKLHVEEGTDGGGNETCDGGEKENLNGDGNLPNLEKLSLGEWFDFLEVYLPKQIVDATEEMFGSMRQKAERLREYIIMQKNQEVTVPME